MDSFHQIKKLWCDKLTLASRRKWKEFGTYAHECWQFYASPTHDFMYTAADGGQSLAAWGLSPGCPRVTVNKSFEMVEVFLPFMHHRNPTRLMTDRRPQIPPELKLALIDPNYINYLGQQAMIAGQPFDPMSLVQPNPQQEALVGIRKALMESVLNYTPHELDLAGESAKSLTEALVAGRGIWWTEVFEGPLGPMAGSFHVPIDEFFVDPDFEHSRHWTWICRERTWPKYKVEREWPHLAGKLKTGGQLANSERMVNIEGKRIRGDRQEGSHDLVTFYEFYSRCGLGGYLSGADEKLQEEVGMLGENVVLYVSDAYEYPFNLDPAILASGNPDEALGMFAEGLKWPLPFHKDPIHPWPMAMLDFHHQPGSAWPVSHLRPALGEQRMLDWIWSHVAQKIQKTAQGKWLYRDDISPETLEAMQKAIDQLWVPVRVAHGESMDSIAKYLQCDEMNRDIWEAAMAFERMFELRTAITPLLLGGGPAKQIRSSYEAQMQDRNSQNRPEAMANKYEDCQSRMARNEGIAISKFSGKDMSRFFGEPYDDAAMPANIGENSRLWDMCVYTEDDDALIAERDFRIESNSMRKPNTMEQLSSLSESAQVILPILVQEWQATGNPGNLNNWLGRYSKLQQIPPIQLAPMPPPMPPGAPPPEKAA